VNRRPLAWLTEDAACRDVHINVFYGDTDDLNNHAKKFCAGCPLVEPCLRHALENGEYGVWGMTTERERKRLGGVTPQAAAPLEHGSEAGARAHSRKGEPACPSCLTAARIAQADRRKSA
jgi:hypothetical protein